MKRLISSSLALFVCVCLLIATERRAMAYVDPGSGLLAIQSIASVFAAVGFFLRRTSLCPLLRGKKTLATPHDIRYADAHVS
jgi:hypothetical protein